MFGLAVLFFLFLWLLLMIFGIWLGGRIGKRYSPKAKFWGMFAGFFLTVGWFVVYIVFLHVEAQWQVNHFCKTHPRLQVFIPPEEYAKITPDNVQQYQKFQYQLINESHINFQGREYEDRTYKISDKTERYTVFSHTEYKGNTSLNFRLHVDRKYHLVFMMKTTAHASLPHHSLLSIFWERPKKCSLDDDEIIKSNDLISHYVLIFGEQS